MALKKYRPLAELAVLSVAALVCHIIFFGLFKPGKTHNFQYSLYELYGFFFSCAAVIMVILIGVRSKNIDSVGNTFMLLTCVKLLLAYWMLRPILSAYPNGAALEKTNFFIIFALFLCMETIVTIRLLNKN